MELRRITVTDGWRKAVEICRNEYQQRIMGTNPSEREARELAYLEHRALDNLLATLNSFVALAEHEALKQMAYGDEDDELIDLT